MIFKIRAAYAVLLCGAVTFCTVGNLVYEAKDGSKPVPYPAKTSNIADFVSDTQADTDLPSANDHPVTISSLFTSEQDEVGEWTGNRYQSDRIIIYDSPSTFEALNTSDAVTVDTAVTGNVLPVTDAITAVVTSAQTASPVTETKKPATTTTAQTKKVTTTTQKTTTAKKQTEPVTTTKAATTTVKTTAAAPVTEPVTTTETAVVTTLPQTSESQTPVTEAVTTAEVFPYDPDIVSPSEIQSQGGLLDIDDPYETYNGGKVTVTGEDRELLECLVYGEAGNQGFVGICLVAQCMRDAMLYEGFDSIAELRAGFKYAGSITRGTSEEVKRAVKFIFDEGGYAVKHPILYFYAPANGIPNTKGFHESQEFVVQYKKSRFFWKKGGTI